MAVREILLLGNPALYRKSVPVRREDLREIEKFVVDLRDTLLDFRQRNAAGRAIAAPQIGIFQRLVYMQVDNPVVFINPLLEPIGSQKITLWDDCMSFPDLLVRVKRVRRCRLRYRDMDWQMNEVELKDELSELLQHECDHLDGILAVSRAVDGSSFALRSQVDASTRGDLSVASQ